MGELLKTEDYSINFIFQDSGDNDYYEFLYTKLPYLLIFITQITLESYNCIVKINKHSFDHLILVTMGCYEALFVDSASQHITPMLKKELKGFLKCIHCSAPLQITKRSAPALYLAEKIKCKNCGLVSEFPLNWLLSMAKISIRQNF